MKPSLTEPKAEMPASPPIPSSTHTPSPVLLSPLPAGSDGIISWSNLFDKSSRDSPLASGSSTPRVSMQEQLPMTTGFTTELSHSPVPQTGKLLGNSADRDTIVEELPEIAITWKALQKICPTMPRGLSNYGNMCFLNSVHHIDHANQPF